MCIYIYIAYIKESHLNAQPQHAERQGNRYFNTQQNHHVSFLTHSNKQPTSRCAGQGRDQYPTPLAILQANRGIYAVCIFLCYVCCPDYFARLLNFFLPRLLTVDFVRLFRSWERLFWLIHYVKVAQSTRCGAVGLRLSGVSVPVRFHHPSGGFPLVYHLRWLSNPVALMAVL